MLLASAASLTVGSPAGAAQPAASSMMSSVQVNLDKPLPPEAVDAALAAENNVATEAVAVFKTAGGELSVGVEIPNDGRSIASTFEKEVRRTLKEMSKDAGRNAATARTQGQTDPLPDQLAAAQSTVDSGVLTVDHLKTSKAPSSTGPLSRLTHFTLADSSRPVQRASAPQFKLPDNKGISRQAASCGDANDSWRPTNPVVNTSRADNRSFLSQRFAWDSYSVNTLWCNGTDITYEAEFWENPSGGTYFNHSAVFSWATNMPHGYLDSNLSDGGRKGTTIGAGDAYNISPNVTYTLNVTMGSGTKSHNGGQINGQLGHRTPNSCYNPNTCIFALVGRVGSC